MEITQILEESGFAHVNDKSYKKDKSPEMGKSDMPAYKSFLYARVPNWLISNRIFDTRPLIIEIL